MRAKSWSEGGVKLGYRLGRPTERFDVQEARFGVGMTSKWPTRVQAQGLEQRKVVGSNSHRAPEIEQAASWRPEKGSCARCVLQQEMRKEECRAVVRDC
jgi:hypothetical protein